VAAELAEAVASADVAPGPSWAVGFVEAELAVAAVRELLVVVAGSPVVEVAAEQSDIARPAVPFAAAVAAVVAAAAAELALAFELAGFVLSSFLCYELTAASVA